MTKVEKALWQKMADLTKEKCWDTCFAMGSCCSIEYCRMAEEIMTEAGEKVPEKRNEDRICGGVKLSSVPFLDKRGTCLIPPHFRPLCSLHQCKISGIGLDPKDPKWTKRYFRIRDRLNAIDAKRQGAKT